MRRRHTITGVLYESFKGSANQAEYRPIPDTEPVTVPCNVHPLSADEIQFYGERSRDMRKVFADSWPFDTLSRLTFEGVPWDQVEPAGNHQLGMGTRHYEVIIRKR